MILDKRELQIAASDQLLAYQLYSYQMAPKFRHATTAPFHAHWNWLPISLPTQYTQSRTLRLPLNYDRSQIRILACVLCLKIGAVKWPWFRVHRWFSSVGWAGNSSSFIHTNYILFVAAFTSHENLFCRSSVSAFLFWVMLL